MSFPTPKNELEPFLETLRRARWTIATKADDTLHLNSKLLVRYPRIPDVYLNFLRHVIECSNSGQNAWFLCANDYNGDEDDNTTFRWNEWERIGLDAADGDEEIVKQIIHFWDNHLPIMSSVHSDYAYLAISFAPDDYGVIVYGYGPMFEESVTKVCGSFSEFLNLFGRIVAGEADEYLTCPEFNDFL